MSRAPEELKPEAGSEDPGRSSPPTEEHLLEQFEAERPGRALFGLPERIVAIVCARCSPCSRSAGCSTRSRPGPTARRSSPSPWR